MTDPCVSRPLPGVSQPGPFHPGSHDFVDHGGNEHRGVDVNVVAASGAVDDWPLRSTHQLSNSLTLQLIWHRSDTIPRCFRSADSSSLRRP